MTKGADERAGAAVIGPVTPTPTDEEAAAIVAAITMAWPRPAATETPTVQPTGWRFSGRWWNRPTWRR